MSQKSFSGNGYGVTTTKSGSTFDILPQATPDFPFKIKKQTLGKQYKVFVTPGTINNLIPNMSSRLMTSKSDNEYPSISITTGALNYVYLVSGPTSSVPKKFPDNLLNGSGYPKIEISTSKKIDTKTVSYLLLGDIQEDGKINQYITSSVGAQALYFSNPDYFEYNYWRL